MYHYHWIGKAPNTTSLPRIGNPGIALSAAVKHSSCCVLRTSFSESTGLHWNARNGFHAVIPQYIFIMHWLGYLLFENSFVYCFTTLLFIIPQIFCISLDTMFVYSWSLTLCNLVSKFFPCVWNLPDTDASKYSCHLLSHTPGGSHWLEYIFLILVEVLNFVPHHPTTLHRYRYPSIQSEGCTGCLCTRYPNSLQKYWCTYVVGCSNIDTIQCISQHAMSGSFWNFVNYVYWIECFSTAYSLT